ncbi:MAG TPA: hypothetical protein PLE45_05050 [Spirochaetota bacterium]|nr:hypothetical protein [Spirochaetota bacterium]HOL56628.1 hypothetical protein [Spirochaetota bacterium]
MKEYEFVIGKNLFEKIKSLKDKRGESISTIIRNIILKVIPVLEKKHLKEERRKKDYPLVMATNKIKVFLPEKVYNELKVIHDHLNTFSIATLVREILEVYFYGVERFGEKEFERKIKKLKEKIDDLKKNKRWVKKEGQDIPTTPTKLYFYLMYHDENFCLRKIKFL